MLTRTFGYLVTWYNLLPPFATIYFILYIMLGVIHGSRTYRLPEYCDTHSNVTYYKGDRAILQCCVKYLGTKQVVIWKKVNENFALTYGEMVFVSDPDFDVDHLPHRDEWNLIISNVQPLHAGLYECQISTKEDLRKYVQLNVLDEPAPRKNAISIEGPQFVDKGKKLVLTCNATGQMFPPEDIDWFKDGQKIKESERKGISIAKFRIAKTKMLHSQMEIDKADMSDKGIYICRSSDLAITSTNVIVLNGKNGPIIEARSPDDKYIDSTKLAETNVIKRGGGNLNANPSDSGASASTSAACSIALILQNGNTLTSVLTMLCCVFVTLQVCYRTL
ncbi:immunoglobulin superfamily DCC subclass member 3-like isoform X3 [Ruditapes philippinarum]|uniref:immunoglobulin superfamily DCC subclass member 3-like isoform X3 n=1 Tax=Ruditapes philippinarum TaxID=129788 RepID=UPI00295B3880|nr:immunoglobulin superfamily DCC subclass member 3-like isoform X3 [Ruditapes philippinarum]